MEELNIVLHKIRWSKSDIVKINDTFFEKCWVIPSKEILYECTTSKLANLSKTGGAQYSMVEGPSGWIFTKYVKLSSMEISAWLALQSDKQTIIDIEYDNIQKEKQEKERQEQERKRYEKQQEKEKEIQKQQEKEKEIQKQQEKEKEIQKKEQKRIMEIEKLKAKRISMEKLEQLNREKEKLEKTLRIKKEEEIENQKSKNWVQKLKEKNLQPKLKEKNWSQKLKEKIKKKKSPKNAAFFDNDSKWRVPLSIKAVNIQKAPMLMLFRANSVPNLGSAARHINTRNHMLKNDRPYEYRRRNSCADDYVY